MYTMTYLNQFTQFRLLQLYVLCGGVCLGGKIKDGSWRVPEELPVAHWRHWRPSASAVEGPAQRGLEGQGLLPLGPAAPASSWLHQVSLPCFLLTLLNSAPYWPYVDAQLEHLKITLSIMCFVKIHLSPN